MPPSAQLCFPELGLLCTIFENIYRGYAYMMLWEIIRFQFGDIMNLANEEGAR